MNTTSEMQLVPIDKLIPYINNARTHSPEQLNKLRSSLREFGFINPVIIDRDFNVIAGHGRILAAKAENISEVPCVFVDYLTHAQKKAYIIADNRMALDAGWDEEMLKVEIEALRADDFDLSLTGFDEKELAAFFDEDSDTKDDDFDVNGELEKPCTTKPGDLWLLGDHRLYCGDSLKMGDVQKATDGQRADLVFTDPPYGMGKESDGVQNDNQNQNDLLEFNKKWIALSFSILKENGSWYCWGIDEPLMDIYAFILRPMIAANQITFRNYITWAKHSAFGVNSELMRSYPRETEKCLFVMCGVEGFNNNKDHFNDAYEAILNYMVGEAQKVGLKAKKLTEITGVQMWGHWFSKSQFTPIPEWHYKKLQQAFKGRAFSLPHDQVMKLRNKPPEAYQSMKAEAMELRAFFDNTHNDSDEHDIMTDVWRFPITNTAERDDAGGHATPKPIALCERAILSSSRPGELVVDFFGGSGSTLIACENTGRTCAMIELEPKWCDVIVRRYIKTTGDNNVRCVRQGRELPREEIAAIFEPDEEGGEQE